MKNKETEHSELQRQSIDLSYHSSEDRLNLRIRQKNKKMSWWLTRRLTVTLVQHWIKKLEEIGLPQVAISNMSPIDRNLHQEHLLSLEFDGPKKKIYSSNQVEAIQAELITEITLVISKIDCQFTVKHLENECKILLTRKEAHALLEMFALKSIEAGWLKLPKWPEWLGINQILKDDQATSV
jgi:hypothetical protein